MSTREPGPATAAMRLRRRAPATETERQEIEAVEAVVHPSDDPSAVAGARALDELLELHSEALVGLCRECLTAHPCRTRQLADIIAGTETPREDSTQ